MCFSPYLGVFFSGGGGGHPRGVGHNVLVQKATRALPRAKAWLMSPDPAPLTQAQLKAVDQLTGGSAHCSKQVGGAKLGFMGKPGFKSTRHTSI